VRDEAMNHGVFDNVLPIVVDKLEKITGVKVSQKELEDAIKHAVHVIIHELAHVYLEKAVPWLSEVEDEKHTLINEVLTRFLERKVSTELNLFVESFEEQLKELKTYSPLRELGWNEDFYRKLYDDFEKCVTHGGSVESFAKEILNRPLKI
jgi:benzoyl-CoA reductase/2-hydroxyglutaryl-CoA dehydratase subunit BcrC/BadD/HgdB